MAWNHRLIAFKQSNGEIYLQIHEVFYDKNKVPDGYTEKPITVGCEDIKGIRWTLNKMKECLKKPILKSWNFPNEYKVETNEN